MANLDTSTLAAKSMADAQAQIDARRERTDCACGDYFGNQCGESAESEMVTVEYMPEQHIPSHKAAGYTSIASAGQYPHNGAIRIAVVSGHEDAIVESADGWAQVI